MDISQVKILLEKYFEGQTDLKEEQVLRDYFHAEVTDKELLPFKQQFMMLQAGWEQEPSGYPEFETKLDMLIDSQSGLPFERTRRLPVFRLAAAAAIVALIAVAGLLVIQSNWHKTRDTYSDPQQAYVEARKTMLFVSQRLNTGIEPLSAVAKINAGTQQLKTLKKLNTSLDMLNMVSFINNSSNLKK